MKKALALILSLAMALSLIPAALAAPSTGTAYPSTQNVDVDGKAVEFQMYALKDENGNDTNYVKARDVAYVLNGTAAQFSVDWNGAVNLVPGQSYAANGSEMSTPFSGERAYAAATASTNVNGQAASLEAIVLNDDNGGGYTYYKLRDLGAALGFSVDWSAEKGVFISTGAQTSAVPADDAAPYLVTVYTADGRSYDVWSNDVDAYVAQGCYTYPVTTIYSANGGTAVVATSEVDTYLAQGWFATAEEATKAAETTAQKEPAKGSGSASGLNRDEINKITNAYNSLSEDLTKIPYNISKASEMETQRVLAGIGASLSKDISGTLKYKGYRNSYLISCFAALESLSLKLYDIQSTCADHMDIPVCAEMYQIYTASKEKVEKAISLVDLDPNPIGKYDENFLNLVDAIADITSVSLKGELIRQIPSDGTWSW